jgi:hypothetical protein
LRLIAIALLVLLRCSRRGWRRTIPTGRMPPRACRPQRQHWLGTDSYGRDLLAPDLRHPRRWGWWRWSPSLPLACWWGFCPATTAAGWSEY